MVPEKQSSGFNPEAQSNPYAQIPNLVRRSLSGSHETRSARRAKERLHGIIGSDRYSDPLFIAIAEAQQTLLTSKGREAQARGIEFIRGIFFVGTRQGKTNNEFRQELVLRVNDQVIQALGNIESNDKRLKRNEFLQQSLPNNYILTVDSIGSLKQDFESAKKRNTKEVKIPLAGVDIKSTSHLELVRQQGNSHNEWLTSLYESTFVEGAKDHIIDTIKHEPDNLGQEKIFGRKLAEVSLQEIEAMEYPLSEENFVKTTAFLTEALSENNLSTAETMAIQGLFFSPTYFQKPTFGPIDFRNRKLLANLNSWQELFADAIVFSKSSKVDDQLMGLLQRIKTENSFAIFMPIACSASSLQMDPDNMTVIDPQQLDIERPRHPILVKAIDAHARRNQDQGSRFVYAEEMVNPYLSEIVLPLLESRLEEFGVGEKFQDQLNHIKEVVNKEDFSSGHLRIIKEIFERHAGSGFLEKIELHKEDIEEITRNVWDNLLGNFHFLPMQEGMNVVEFSEESVPSILGLKSLIMIRAGSEQNWKINISFTLQNRPIQLFANLNQDGKLEFRAPVAQGIPGLYTMLNHIAVLTFHDLVVQERKEREGGSRAPTRQPIQQEPQLPTPDKDNDEGKEEGVLSQRSQTRNLPRVQRDRQLISDVYHATNREPRRVELHDRFLPGARVYQSAVESYNEAISGNVSEETLFSTRTKLEVARTSVFSISEGKRLNTPAKFQLPAITDPITGELKYLKTWVIEHTSPKPTEEELKSPLRLYQRYYRNSSALASLDQMKPWFIGQ